MSEAMKATRPPRIGLRVDGMHCASCFARIEGALAEDNGVEETSVNLELSPQTMRTIKQNLVGAFAYNVSLIPVAAGVLYPIWGVTCEPDLAAVAMAASSVTVVGSAVRPRAFR